MDKVKEKGVFLNPYVMQMDKFADSLIHLSKTFFTLEGYKGALSEEELENMFRDVTGSVCEGCVKKRNLSGSRAACSVPDDVRCVVYSRRVWGGDQCRVKTENAEAVSESTEVLAETLERYESAKQVMLWNNKIVKNREGYAGQMKSFAKMIQYTTRELDAGIFEDSHLEKKLKNHLKKHGVKMMSSVFYLTPQGKYEIHLTVKAMKGHCIVTKELAAEVGKCVGRVMMPQQGERPILGEDYSTVACVEGARYHTLQGVARIGKDCDKISGDTFLMTDLPGGKKGVALSDGMGSGEEAFKESTMVVEMLEELLEAGFPVKMAIQMMNTALVIGREDVRFSTIDAAIFDLYTGECEFVKAGASATFVKQNGKVEKISSTTLPIGVLQDIEIQTDTRVLSSGDYVIMVTDGVMDALPAGEQDTMMCAFIEGTDIVNPKELAHYLLGKVLEQSGENPADDMTIVTAGIWKL